MKKTIAITTAVAAFLLLGHPRDISGTALPIVDTEEVVATEKVTLVPEMVPICACESTGRKDGTPRQFEDDGVTVRYGRVNNNDKGLCQINTEPRNGHVVIAQRLGFDLMTEEGNIRYANWLYLKEGTQPWISSASCWQ